MYPIMPQNRSLFAAQFLAGCAFFLISYAGSAQKLFDPVHLKNPALYGPETAEKLVTEEVYEYKLPKGTCVQLKNGFRKSEFVNAEDWLKIKDSVDAVGVDIVYSKYPIRDGEYKEIYPLLMNRVLSTITIDPALNTSKIRWRKILQTHCENNTQVDQLFHGVIIWYEVRKRPEEHPYIPVPPPPAPPKEPKTPTKPTEEPMDNPTVEASGTDVIQYILNHENTPDSIRNLAQGKSHDEQVKILENYYAQQELANPSEENVENPVTRMGYMYAVESFMRQFPKVDPVVEKVLDRHPEWKTKIVINDWTGSMYGYGSQVLLWHLLNIDSSGITTITLFNDGDSKTTEKKAIGHTGGIYTEDADNAQSLIDLFTKVMEKGGGGDGPENDIEAILKAIKGQPEDAEIILIADNRACVRDIELAEKIGRPVRVVLCGYDKKTGVNPDFIYLAKITGGGIYTIENDIENIVTEVDDHGTIVEFDDERIELSSAQCFDQVFGSPEGQRYTLTKARRHKKKVHVLDASRKQLVEIPRYVYKMENIQMLDIHDNYLTEISDNLLNMRRLSALDASNNQLKALPKSFQKFSLLEYLYLAHNQLEAVPEGLYALSFLRELDLSHNQLTEFEKPKSRFLTHLDVSYNQIKRLPSLSRQRELRTFSAAHNQLTEFPGNISLKNLEELDLSFNQVYTLPADLTPFKNLKKLNLQGNPISETERIRIREALFYTDLTF